MGKWGRAQSIQLTVYTCLSGMYLMSYKSETESSPQKVKDYKKTSLLVPKRTICTQIVEQVQRIHKGLKGLVTRKAPGYKTMPKKNHPIHAGAKTQTS